MSEKLLVRFYSDQYYGSIDGLFITTREMYDKCIGKYVYFGEVLGKHSEVDLTISEDDLEIISNDPDLISKLGDLFKGNTLCGSHLFDMVDPEQFDSEDEPNA